MLCLRQERQPLQEHPASGVAVHSVQEFVPRDPTHARPARRFGKAVNVEGKVQRACSSYQTLRPDDNGIAAFSLLGNYRSCDFNI